jgi:hypothetical protein
MRLLKINLAQLYPDNIYLSSKSNEKDTTGDIMEMGRNLSNEIE